MKRIEVTNTEGYTLIRGFDPNPPPIDPAKTRRRIQQKASRVEQRSKTRKELIQKYAVSFAPKSSEHVVSDKEWARLKKKYHILPSYHKLSIDGELIPDYRRVPIIERNEDGTFTEHKKGLRLGQSLKENQWVEEDAPQEIQEELTDYREAERVKNLSNDERTNELERELDAAADRIEREQSKATLRGKSYDATSEYRKAEARLRKHYGVENS